MKSMIRSAMTAALVAMFSVVGAAGVAQAAEVTLYEVSEAVKLDPSKGGKFKSNTGTLTGWAQAGTALCPQFIVDAMGVADTKVCALSIDAAGRADDVTGIGPVTGTLIVLIQDKNQTDAPEVSVITGQISGTIDMSKAFQNGQPLGSISGRYQIQGAPNSIASRYSGSGTFNGTFRLPFVLNGGQPQYLLDDGSTVAIAAAEYVLRYPAVRLEVTLSPSAR